MVKDNERRSSHRKPLYRQTEDALAKILTDMTPGEFLPSEPALSKKLGVSRATLREAMRSFEERGLIIRRQGVGTYVTSPPQVIDAGLEVLESIETMAERIGLKVDMGALVINEREPYIDESTLLEISTQKPVLEISRVINADKRPVAFLIDVVPKDIFPEEALKNGFRGSVLDLLLQRGVVDLDLSRTEITAVSVQPDVARHMKIQRGDVLLHFEAYLFTRDGRAIDHSQSYFLPGTFRFHVMRRVGGCS